MTENPACLTEKTPHLLLEVRADCLPEFFELLQNGFFLQTPYIGQSIRYFLTHQLGLSEEYLAHRISTVFLDGMPVDDMDTALLTDRCRLALSSAMPGLVGATMRKNSPLALLRDGISYRAPRPAGSGNGVICLKLFNTVMQDLGPRILRTGLLLKPETLRMFLHNQSESLLPCKQIQLNERPYSPALLLNALQEMQDGFIEMVTKPVHQG